MRTIDWYGLYKQQWKDDLVPAAYSHPAKFNRGLIRCIYQHMLKRGYIKPDDWVLDPFAGVACGAYDAILLGLHWRGVELEHGFAGIADDNIALWREKKRFFPHREEGTAVIYQGDSRDLRQGLCSKFQALISSPPYEDTVKSGEGPGARHDFEFHSAEMATKKTSVAAYGATKANAGNVKGNEFWNMMDEIMAQVRMALVSGAVCAWVTGDYVRKGQRVPFGRQWLELCETHGFELVEWARAWKTEYTGTQLDIFGHEHDQVIDRVSLFRRQANERNPEAAVLNEDVIFVRKV